MSYKSVDTEDPPSPRATRESGSSTFEASINLSKLCIGSGILALPFAVDKGGLILTPVLIALVGWWNGVSCDLMIQSKNEMVRRAYVTPPEATSTYSMIAYCAGGWSAVYVTDFCIIVTLLGVCVTYLITFTTLLRDIPGMPLSTAQLAFLSTIVLMPACSTSNVGQLSFISFIGLVILILAVCALAMFGLYYYGAEVSADPWGSLTVFPSSVEDFSTVLGIATFGFGLPSLAFPVEESMKEPREFAKASRWALIFVWGMYAFVGDGVAVLFEHDPRGISSNVLTNLPIESRVAHIVRILMALVNLMTFPLTFMPPAMMIERILSSSMKSGVCQRWHLSLCKQSDSAGVSMGSGSGKIRGVALTSGGTLTQNYESGVELASMDEEDRVEVPIWVSYGVRMTLLCLCEYLATSIPCFGLIVSLLGCFTVTILSYVIPPYVSLEMITAPARANGNGDPHVFWEYCRDFLLVTFGTVLCVVSSFIVGSQALAAFREGVC